MRALQVVAVPEGLPLAVTIALAYSMQKMMKVGGARGCRCCSPLHSPRQPSAAWALVSLLSTEQDNTTLCAS